MNQKSILIQLRSSIFFLLVIFALAPKTASSEEKQGEQIYQQCITCHGKQGQGNTDLKSPQLAGQHDWYLTRQLHNFKTGIRGNHQKDFFGQQMIPLAQVLSEHDTKLIARYLSSLESETNKPSQVDQKNGYRYYQAKCGACHGGRAEGNAAFNAPKIASQNIDYLMRQMTNFKNGVRGNHPSDKLGKQMAMMSKIVSDKELEDILNYVTQL
ncbi:MAG: cytochrome c [Shewanella sp.]|nr:cytochrome c [Shewanella sp.]